jgi:hypothetical protein
MRGYQLLELSDKSVTYETTLKPQGYAHIVIVPKQWLRLMNLRSYDKVKVTVECERVMEAAVS